MMKFTVKVKPGSKKSLVKVADTNKLEVSVSERPEKGKANEAVIALIASHYGVPKSRVSILRGMKSKNKMIEVQL